MNFPEDALQPVDTLGYSGVDGVIVVDVHVLESLHLQGVEVHINRQQVEGEVTDVHELAQPMPLEELFADNGPFGPEAGEVPLAPFVAVHLDQFLEGDQVLASGLEEDDDLVEVDGQGEGLERQDAALIRNPVRRQYFPLDD